MYCVILESNEKHSIWNTREEANNQIRVLKDYGYKRPYIKFYAGYAGQFENGHYFV
jgi:hypothetical protein